MKNFIGPIYTIKITQPLSYCGMQSCRGRQVHTRQYYTCFDSKTCITYSAFVPTGNQMMKELRREDVISDLVWLRLMNAFLSISPLFFGFLSYFSDDDVQCHFTQLFFQTKQSWKMGQVGLDLVYEKCIVEFWVTRRKMEF